MFCFPPISPQIPVTWVDASVDIQTPQVQLRSWGLLLPTKPSGLDETQIFKNQHKIQGQGKTAPCSKLGMLQCGLEKKKEWNTGTHFFCCCSVAKLCPTPCDPMNCSRPGFPVLHHLLEFTQTHVHWVSDAIQQPHPLSPPSPPALNLSQHQGPEHRQ